MALIEIKVPDIGDFKEVEIIEILVQPGDTVAQEASLATLESDKASMEVPSSDSGVVKELRVQVGEKVSEGSVLLLLETEVAAASPEPFQPKIVAEPSQTAPPISPATPEAGAFAGEADLSCEVLVLGSGPGGYTAAFRAADLGKQVVLVERYESIGGGCLNVGCIPSKALLHAAKVIDETKAMREHGIEFGPPQFDLDKLRGWKDRVVKQLTGGLKQLSKQRKVKLVTGVGTFLDPHHLQARAADGSATTIHFEHAVIAAGSQSVNLPFLPNDPRIIDSTGALELRGIPEHLLVIGGGIIGLEMATVFHALGAKITVVEMLDSLMAGADKDIVRPFQKTIGKLYENIWLETRVTAVAAQKKGLKVTFEGKHAPEQPLVFDRILSAVGRSPNGKKIAANQAGVVVDERGFIAVDSQMRTNVPHIFAIGDIVGQPMLAHKATHEGKIAAEVISGMKSHFDARVIPSVAYTDPEVAWVGVTETEAKAQGIKIGIGRFPWAASGRSLSLGRSEGLTKVIFDERTGRVIGAGIVGPNAGDLIAEVALAIEMGCEASDLGATIHPHPTLSETIAFAAETFEGTITDLYLPKRKQAAS